RQDLRAAGRRATHARDLGPGAAGSPAIRRGGLHRALAQPRGARQGLARRRLISSSLASRSAAPEPVGESAQGRGQAPGARRLDRRKLLLQLLISRRGYCGMKFNLALAGELPARRGAPGVQHEAIFVGETDVELLEAELAQRLDQERHI